MAVENCPGSGRWGWREWDTVQCRYCGAILSLKSVPAGAQAHVPVHYSMRKAKK